MQDVRNVLATDRLLGDYNHVQGCINIHVQLHFDVVFAYSAQAPSGRRTSLFSSG